MNIKYNIKGYQVLTPDGYKPFEGVAYMGDKETIKIFFDDDWIQVSLKHRFFNEYENDVYAQDLKLGNKILSTTGYHTVTRIEKMDVESVYDLIEVSGHKYYTNGVLSHNCQFISFEETLISAHILKNLRGISPVEQRGRVRWYSQIQPNKVYIAGLDPSMGTGGDNAAITVWQLPEFIQVAEWKHNKTDTKEQVRILLDILIDIYKQMKAIPEQQGKPEIYWSVENNTLGEATLQIIDATGEEKFPGDFVHEPAKKRKGFTTGHKQKIEACVRLKNLIEHKKMHVNSISMCEELKSFVRSNRSYAAKAGQTDDIVMSSILCVRILNEIQNWDDEIHDTLADIINVNDEDVEPLPAIFV